MHKKLKHLKRNNSSSTPETPGQKLHRMSVDSSQCGLSTHPSHRPADSSVSTPPERANPETVADISIFCNYVAMELKTISSNTEVFCVAKREIIDVIYKAQTGIFRKLRNYEIEMDCNNSEKQIIQNNLSSASGPDNSKKTSSTDGNDLKAVSSSSSSESNSSSKSSSQTSLSSMQLILSVEENSSKAPSKKSLKSAVVCAPNSPPSPENQVQTALSTDYYIAPSYPPSIHDGFGRTPEFLYASTFSELNIEFPEMKQVVPSGQGDVEQEMSKNETSETEKIQEAFDPQVESSFLFVCSYCFRYTEFCHFCSQCIPNVAICEMCEKTTLHPHILNMRGLGLDKGFFEISLTPRMGFEEAERVYALRFLQSVCHTRVCSGNRCEQLGCHLMKEQLKHFSECRLPQCTTCSRLRILCCNNNLKMVECCPGPFCKTKSQSAAEPSNEVALLNATYFSHIRENFQSRLFALQLLLTCCICKCSLTLPSSVCLYAHIVCGACLALQADSSGCILCQSAKDRAFTMALNVLTSVKV